MSPHSYYLFTISVSFFAGLTQGLTGFGSALVAMPFFVEILPARSAVSLSILNGLLITSLLTLRHRRDVRFSNVAPLVIGAIPGIILGIAFLKHANEGLIRKLLGLLLVTYATYSLIAREKIPRLRPNALWGTLAGLLTGLIGASFSAGGPPTIIYVTLTGWSKDEMKATLSAFFLFTGASIALGHALSGITDQDVLLLFLLNAPFVAIGVALGMRAYTRIPRELYLRGILLLLLLMGILLMFG